MKLAQELEFYVENLSVYLQDRAGWSSLSIDKYPPVIHRLSYTINSERTLLLHKLHHCQNEKAYMHSHSWPFAVKVIEGGYEMGVGYSTDRAVVPDATFSCIVKPGDIYQMQDMNMWHYTKPLGDCQASYSIMLLGPRRRERLAQNNDPLSNEQIEQLFAYFDGITTVEGQRTDYSTILSNRS